MGIPLMVGHGFHQTTLATPPTPHPWQSCMVGEGCNQPATTRVTKTGSGVLWPCCTSCALPHD